MWRAVGLFRNREGVSATVNLLEAAYRNYNRTPLEADRRQLNFVTAAMLIARAALRREESRGAHYREDFPARDDAHWKRHVAEVQ
jgi:L-aspartate oxidase